MRPATSGTVGRAPGEPPARRAARAAEREARRDPGCGASSCSWSAASTSDRRARDRGPCRRRRWTIYRYFESKEALVNALYREHKMRVRARRPRRFPDHGAARASSFACCGCGWRSSRPRHPTRSCSWSSITTPLPRRREPRARSSACSICSRVVIAAQARGELKAGPPRLLMGIVMGAFVGVIRSCVEMDQPLDERRLEARRAVRLGSHPADPTLKSRPLAAFKPCFYSP